MYVLLIPNFLFLCLFFIPSIQTSGRYRYTFKFNIFIHITFFSLTFFITFPAFVSLFTITSIGSQNRLCRILYKTRTDHVYLVLFFFLFATSFFIFSKSILLCFYEIVLDFHFTFSYLPAE